MIDQILGKTISMVKNQFHASAVGLDAVFTFPYETYGGILHGFTKYFNEDFKAAFYNF